ncbi:hypothetical protein AMS68_006049 [Peltaster fructicola]|uniref:VOC domain-containing protein n=1 Tax=Peltaster fructicola TaxID=286661 RepID=A0A6H0Y0H5_9PEZI|nr:hypothetical protein AMS68_006049 [Peltaster fructicola]
MSDSEGVAVNGDATYVGRRPSPSGRDTKRIRTQTQSLPPPSLPQLVAEQAHPIPSSDKDTQRLIVVLSNASLETYKSSHGGRGGAKDEKYALLNSDEHIGVMRKMNRDISDARPDITHQCLLTLLDSPVNKAGKLQIYIHTAKGVLIEVSPTVRIPRTFKRFAGLMVQLLHKLSIRSTTSQEKLLKVIKNPITDHLPPNCRKVTLSFDAPVVRVRDYIADLGPKESICVFVGAMAKGADTFADQFKDDSISISNYSLSASVACISHLGLTVSYIPTSTDFYLSALRPLGYRYHGTRGDSIGLGVHEADFFLTQEPEGYRIAPTHIAFAAQDRTTVRDCYTAALNAGGRPSGPPSYRQDDCKCFNAAVEDLDGNTIEFIWRDNDLRGHHDGADSHDRRPMTNYPHNRDVDAYSRTSPRLGIQRAQTDPVDNSASRSLFGVVLGAAAGAAALAMITASRDSNRKDDHHSADDRPNSRERTSDYRDHNTRRSASVAEKSYRRGSLPASHKSEYIPAHFVVRQIEARPYRDDENISYTRQTVTRQSEGRSRAIEAIEYGPSRFSARRSDTMPLEVDDAESRRSGRRSSIHPDDQASRHSGRRSSIQPSAPEVTRHSSRGGSSQHSELQDYNTANHSSKRSSANHSASRRDSVVSGATSRSYRSAKEHARSSTSQASTVKPIKKSSAHYAHSAAAVPLPPSLVSEVRTQVKTQPKAFDAYYLPGVDDEESDGLGDTATIVPDDSISCINLPSSHKRRSRSRRSSRAERNGSVMTIPVRSRREEGARTRNAYSNA